MDSVDESRDQLGIGYQEGNNDRRRKIHLVEVGMEVVAE